MCNQSLAIFLPREIPEKIMKIIMKQKKLKPVFLSKAEKTEIIKTPVKKQRNSIITKRKCVKNKEVPTKNQTISANSKNNPYYLYH